MAAPPALREREECLAGCLTDWSVVSGVYPVMRKCNRGVGISEAISPMRSLFMYPGYLSVVVLADMMVETWGRGWSQRLCHRVVAEHIQNLLHTAVPGEAGAPVEAAPGKVRRPLFTAPGCPPSRPAHGAGSDQIEDSGEAPCWLLQREEPFSPAG